MIFWRNQMRRKAENRKNNQERGVALLFALFTLLLISAIAVSLVFMTNTETSVNSNYRAERVSAFAAKSGMEEVRDRLPALIAAGQLGNLPTQGVFPPAAGSVLYLLNEGAAPGTVQPWAAGNAYTDDELCHDFPALQALQPTASDVRCTTAPSAGWLLPNVTSNYPWSGTAAALGYKWVRVTLKQNNSNPQYPVNNAGAPATQVCMNGGNNEVLLNLVGNPTNNCQGMTPSTMPVYVITALAASATGTTRRMVQAEVAIPPAQPFPWGLYATGNTCPALNFHGGGNSNPATDSYNSKNGAYGGANQFNTGGDVGSNGGVSLTGHAQIGGAVGVLSLTGVPPNPCVGGDYSTTGGAGIYNPGNSLPNNIAKTIPPFTFPTPPNPTPLPTAASPQPTNPAVPGTYGNINLNGVLTLAPGVYNINSLTIGGGSGALTVAPPGAVVLNFPSTSANPITLSGQGILNSTLIPNDLQINYGGTGTISITGKGASYAIVDAPNAAIQVAGNGDFFGRLVGRTIDYGGNGKFHFDTSSALGPQSNSGYILLSYREVAY
jgi:Tfp pilus assembly protein PilX